MKSSRDSEVFDGYMYCIVLSKEDDKKLYNDIVFL